MSAKKTHGATLGPGAREGDPSKRPAARNACVRLLAARAGVGKPTPASDPHPGHHDRAHCGGESDRHRRRAAVGDGRHSRTERVRRRTARGSRSASCPAYIAIALALGAYWITRRTVLALRWAIEERKPTHVDERNTFLAPWRVALADLILWGIGTVLLTTLYGTGQHAVHPAVPVRGGLLRPAGRHRQLSARRVRAAPGGRSGARGGTTAAAADGGHHGPNHDGLVAGLRCARHRHRPDGHLPDRDAESDRDPVRGRRADRVGRRR